MQRKRIEDISSTFLEQSFLPWIHGRVPGSFPSSAQTKETRMLGWGLGFGHSSLGSPRATAVKRVFLLSGGLWTFEQDSNLHPTITEPKQPSLLLSKSPWGLCQNYIFRNISLEWKLCERPGQEC